MDPKKTELQENQRILLKTLRIMGAMTCILGLLLIFNIEGIGIVIFGESGVIVSRMLGSVLCIVGILDMILIPRIFEIISARTQK